MLLGHEPNEITKLLHPAQKALTGFEPTDKGLQPSTKPFCNKAKRIVLFKLRKT